MNEQRQSQLNLSNNQLQSAKKQEYVIENSNTNLKVSKSIIEISQIKISQQEIIIKDSSQKGLVNSIVCPICLMTLPLPYYQCEKCSNSFCPNCIQVWWSKLPSQKQCIFKCQNPTFKKVKRSNTYVALLESLEFQCNLCSNAYPLSNYQKHKFKECQEADVTCSNINCKLILKRKNQVQHQKVCQWRFESCQYCKNLFISKVLFEHENKQCGERTLKCINKKCGQLIKLTQFEVHISSCEYKQQKCLWCNQEFLSKQFNEHKKTCEKRTYECEWCSIKFIIKDYEIHDCQMRTEQCRLCYKNVLVKQTYDHRRDCMFQNMVNIKYQNKVLIEQNNKLYRKIDDLQELIEDTISSILFLTLLDSEFKTLEVMKNLKLKEKKNLEKDLLRVQNSWKSVVKLQEQEIQKHMTKYNHFLGKSLCISCKKIDQKFNQMKAPLIQKRKQIFKSIEELDNISYTAKE